MADDQLPSRMADYLNARVTVNYSGQALGFSDTGVLTYLDADWIELTKDKGERMLIPAGSVRQIKLLDPVRRTEDPSTLLRPSTRDGLEKIE